jgi:hypothetical protein
MSGHPAPGKVVCQGLQESVSSRAPGLYLFFYICLLFYLRPRVLCRLEPLVFIYMYIYIYVYVYVYVYIYMYICIYIYIYIYVYIYIYCVQGSVSSRAPCLYLFIYLFVYFVLFICLCPRVCLILSSWGLILSRTIGTIGTYV